MNDPGAALLIVLLATMLIGALAAAAIVLSTADSSVSLNFRATEEAVAAADAAVNRALAELEAAPDWTTVLAGGLAGFSDGNSRPLAPDGHALDLANLTAARQADSDSTYGAGNPDAPRWRLFAHKPLADVVEDASVPGIAYVIVWVADDPADGDGNPGRDANGRLLVHADAYGLAGSRREAEALVEYPGRVVNWRVVR
jgi:hypothetical protein